MKFGDLVYILFLAGVALFMAVEDTRNLFVQATRSLPPVMGFLKFLILATSGELLSRRLATGKWRFTGFHIMNRAFVWGIIGVMAVFIFPFFAKGAEALFQKGLLPIFPESFKELHTVSKALWISFFLNIVFGFQMMVFHQLTDRLIDEKRFWKKWRVIETWKHMDWKRIFTFILPSIFWFWLPMQTVTFCLPEEYQVLMAAFLGIALGLILSFKKRD